MLFRNAARKMDMRVHWIFWRVVQLPQTGMKPQRALQRLSYPEKKLFVDHMFRLGREAKFRSMACMFEVGRKARLIQFGLSLQFAVLLLPAS